MSKREVLGRPGGYDMAILQAAAEAMDATSVRYYGRRLPKKHRDDIAAAALLAATPLILAAVRESA